MPAACLFICLACPGMLLLVPGLVIAWALSRRGRRRLAVMVAAIPVGMVALSALLTVLILVIFWFHGIRMSSHPDLLFKETFHFEPPPGTQVLNGYCDEGLEYAATVLKFRTTKDIIDRIASRKFTRSDRETVMRSYESNSSNLPERVRLWFLPPQELSIHWYIAGGFDGMFGHDEAILCYDEDTQIAYFHWVGVD